MKFVFRKKKNIADKNKVHTDTIVKEESRIENLKVFGILRKKNVYCLVFEFVKDGIQSTAVVSRETLKDYIKCLRQLSSQESREEECCNAIKHHLKAVKPNGRTDQMFESVLRISQILNTSSAMKDIIYKGPMLKTFKNTASDKDVKNFLLLKIGICINEELIFIFSGLFV
jgi:hypothetical protein